MSSKSMWVQNNFLETTTLVKNDAFLNNTNGEM